MIPSICISRENTTKGNVYRDRIHINNCTLQWSDRPLNHTFIHTRLWKYDDIRVTADLFHAY
jgi:hypothetical protein